MHIETGEHVLLLLLAQYHTRPEVNRVAGDTGVVAAAAVQRCAGTAERTGVYRIMSESSSIDSATGSIRG